MGIHSAETLQLTESILPACARSFISLALFFQQCCANTNMSARHCARHQGTIIYQMDTVLTIVRKLPVE